MKPKLILCIALVLSGNCFAAIVFPKAPDGGQQVISNYVGHDVVFNDFDKLHGLKMEDLTIANPFLIYDVGLTNLAEGRLLSATEACWWQYLLLHGTNTVGAAALCETNGKLRIVGYYETYFSSETLEALRIAEQLPQVKKQDYELRGLESLPIHFVAMWLHGKSDDIIIPLPPTFGRWKAYQSYSESEMIELLKSEPEKKLE
jgi:hypothetical protein